MAESNSAVLSRKYRPKVFNDLIGQQALVQTITNAINQNKLAHAYILTGIRGIGKTSSARIIAKGLNCVGEDGKGEMTPNPCGKCPHCLNISSDSDMDVIEIDAASNTGVDNIREIIEGAKYNPVSARFKIYIIDEVHMLSKQAFNALLKTLEEPPERVKFILATTEIRKVPATILSRCQRFDLKRVEEEVLANHLMNVVVAEGRIADKNALLLIARTGEGSVRDSLSLLDQALTHYPENLTLENVQKMLGLSDKRVLFDLFEILLKGDMPTVLKITKEQYESGADSLNLAQELLSLTHWLTRVKIIPSIADDMTLPEIYRTQGVKIAKEISISQLTVIWQMMIRGIQEIKQADNPFMALEMMLIRLGYLAEIPSLTQLTAEAKKKSNLEITEKKTPDLEKSSSETNLSFSLSKEEAKQEETKKEPLISFKTMAEISSFARQKKEMILAFNIENYLRLIELKENKLICGITEDAPPKLGQELNQFLNQNTGQHWQVLIQEGGGQTVREKKEEERVNAINEAKKDPLVAEVLKEFKGAKITAIRLIKKPEELTEEDTTTEELN